MRYYPPQNFDEAVMLARAMLQAKFYGSPIGKRVEIKYFPDFHNAAFIEITEEDLSISREHVRAEAKEAIATGEPLTTEAVKYLIDLIAEDERHENLTGAAGRPKKSAIAQWNDFQPIHDVIRRLEIWGYSPLTRTPDAEPNSICDVVATAMNFLKRKTPNTHDAVYKAYQRGRQNFVRPNRTVQ